MADHELERASTTEGLPVSVSLGPTLEAAAVPQHSSLVDARVVFISCLAILVAIAAAFIAQYLMHLIGFVTGISFYGKPFLIECVTALLSFRIPPAPVGLPPTNQHLGVFVILVPVIGGLIVGAMARYGHKAI